MINCENCPHWQKHRDATHGQCLKSDSVKGAPTQVTAMWGVSRNGRGHAYAFTEPTFVCNQHPKFPERAESVMSKLTRRFTSLFEPAHIIICLLLPLVALSSFAQEGPVVNQSDGPPARAFTSLFFYDGSNRLEYQCLADSNSRRSQLTVTAATNATPIAITVGENHGLLTGSIVTISQVAGNTAANGSWQIVSTGATTFTLKDRVTAANVAGNGTYTANTGIVVTDAPRTNVAQWAILKLAYDGSGNLASKKWIEGSTDTRSGGKICDNRANYGTQ